jgi:SAM-dependent methyltransferase
MPVNDATQRFSSRVANYIRYRPGYPPEVLELLQSECGLTRASVIADVGSGTGILTRMFLENGNHVFGIEPNPDMRRAGEELLASYPALVSIDGRAEATTLPSHSVDFVTAGQAAHWFDRVTARREFVRILKPDGWAVLVWNERCIDTRFLQDYEQLLLTYGTDYQVVRHEHTASMNDFFPPSVYQVHVFPMNQEFDYPALAGRLLSSSYTPSPGDEKYEPMLAALRRIFEKHQLGGRVAFNYKTRVYYARLR